MGDGNYVAIDGRSRILIDVSKFVSAQINGKLKKAIEVASDIGQADAEAAAQSDPTISKVMSGKSIKKVIFVPGRILNFIVPLK